MAEGFVAAGDDLMAKLASGMEAFAEMIMAESLIQCPIETGTLRGSARIGKLTGWDFAFAPGGGFQRSIRGEGGRFVGAVEAGGAAEMSLVIGYGYGDEINPKTHRPASEYAVPVHEIIEAYHEPPTKAKFLEDPVFEHASLMEPTLAAHMMAIVDPAFALNAMIEGDSEMISEGAGVRSSGLDAGDHPKGTPHD